MAWYAYTREFEYLPKGYIELYTSEELFIGCTGYSGVALYNRAKKELVIVSEGTSFGQDNPVDLTLDIVNNLQIASRELPYQYTHGCKPFAKAVFAKIGKELGNLKINFVGHSLGAVLSEIAKYELCKGIKKCAAVTFESPGALPIIQKNFDPKVKSVENVIAYNGEPNLVNTIHHATGKVVYVRDHIGYEYEPVKNLGGLFKAFAKSQIQAHSLETIKSNLDYCNLTPVTNWPEHVLLGDYEPIYESV